MTTLKSNLLKKGKKGFTLTELAIVIAVIAILIAVLVPTFSSIITKAKVSNESVACKNEWTNFYIDADIAASGTDANYLVVYTDNSYSDSNSKTYYHGYLATAGVYDTETQYDVTISSSNIATCGSVSYNYVGSYEYMATDKVAIYSTGTTSSLSATYGKDSVDNDGLTITGSGDTYYLTGSFVYSSGNATLISTQGFNQEGYTAKVYCLFCIRVYFEGAIDHGYISGTNEENPFSSSNLDGNYFMDCLLSGNTKKYVITYYTNSSDTTPAGTITIYNNATPLTEDSSSGS